MDRMTAAAERRERRDRTRLRNWYRSQMDCGDDGCGECRVCRHLDFQDYVRAVASSDVPSFVSYDPEVVAYLSRRK
jgi:hypothetical protein